MNLPDYAFYATGPMRPTHCV